MRLMMTAQLLFFWMSVASFATDRFYRDITEYSTSRRYKVEAKSPDNQKGRRKAFQSKFVYRCIDTKSGVTLWTRMQPMDEPLVLESGYTINLPAEGSPIDLVVSNDGWTAIRTDWDELVCVDPMGTDRAIIDLLKDAISEKECDEFAVATLHGILWSGYSLWYFLDSNEGPVFVVRPWWGRRIVVDLLKGELIKETPAVVEAANAYETKYVLTNLDSARKNGVDAEDIWPILYAAYLAGRLEVKDAIPELETLENSIYSGSSTFRPGNRDEVDGEIDPHSYSEYTLRQIAQLSLRRLGKKPKALPNYSFDIRTQDKTEPFQTPVLRVPRDENADQIKVGMTAKQILNLIGSPDFIGNDTWSYDMDSDTPYSLNVTFDEKTVVKLTRDTTPIWKSGLLRDKAIVY